MCSNERVHCQDCFDSGHKVGFQQGRQAMKAELLGEMKNRLEELSDNMEELVVETMEQVGIEQTDGN